MDLKWRKFHLAAIAGASTPLSRDHTANEKSLVCHPMLG
jgi:hypothetical protein